MKSLSIADKVHLPIEVATQTTAILGIRGSGKTHTAKVVAEELLASGQQLVVIDPLDAWWGLKSSADGKRGGFPVVVLGGQHGDLPLNAGDGATVADFVVENFVPVILSLRHLSKGDQRKFVTAFCERLYFRKGEPGRQQPLPIFIDEASSFVPQRVQGDSARMVGAIEDFVRRGRQSGIGVVLIDQRAASVNKDVLTQIEMLICHRTVSPQDRDQLKAWIQAHDTEGYEKEFMSTLASLERGEAWIWSPGWLNMFQRASIRGLKTFDSSATPKAGAKQLTPQKFANVDLDALRSRLATTIEEAKSKDPKELTKQIAELKRDLAKAQSVKPQTEVKEVPVLTDAHILELRGFVDSLKVFGEQATRISDGILQAISSHKPMREVKPAPVKAVPTRPVPVVKRIEPAPSDDLHIKAGARRMLEVLAAHSQFRVTKAQLATLAKMKVTGGTFGTYFSTLKRSGFINEQSGALQITDAGMDYLGISAPPPPQTTAELVAQWRTALKRGAAEMLDILVEEYPESLTKQDLAERLGMAVSGGTFGTYLSTLKRNGLIEVSDGEARASETLFFG